MAPVPKMLGKKKEGEKFEIIEYILEQQRKESVLNENERTRKEGLGIFKPYYGLD